MEDTELFRIGMVALFAVIIGFLVYANTEKDEYNHYRCVLNDATYGVIIMILCGIVYFGWFFKN